MSLLREFLRIDADRRAAHESLRGEIAHRRSRVEELAGEARRRRDEIAMLEDGLHRLSGDIARVEQEILEFESRRDEHERDAARRRAEALRAAIAADEKASDQLSGDYRQLRAGFQEERERILAQPETGRMMDNYFQIETFLKDAAHPIPDAARKALARERQELLGKIGPLVAPPPVPDGVLRATLAWSGIEEPEARALVALGLATPKSPDDATDLPATLLYGAYSSAAVRFGEKAPRPVRHGEAFLFEMGSLATGAEEAALELFLALEEGITKAAAAVSVRCELTGVFVDPRTAGEVFSPAGA